MSLNNEEVYLSDAIAVIDEVLASGGEFRLYPKGTSMLPLLVQGKDSVILKRKSHDQLKKHDIAFYRRESGQFVLHRIMKIEANGSYTMCGDNQLVMERGIRADQIIGYVSEIYKGEKLRRLSSLRYRAYMFFWMCMPYRQIIRFPKRVFFAIKRRCFGNKSS